MIKPENHWKLILALVIIAVIVSNVCGAIRGMDNTYGSDTLGYIKIDDITKYRINILVNNEDKVILTTNKFDLKITEHSREYSRYKKWDINTVYDSDKEYINNNRCNVQLSISDKNEIYAALTYEISDNSIVVLSIVTHDLNLDTGKELVNNIFSSYSNMNFGSNYNFW